MAQDTTIWVVAAVPAELRLLLAELDARPAEPLAGGETWMATLPGVAVRLAPVGVGLAAAAGRLGGLMALRPADEVIMVGSAGALPGSGLRIGDAVVVVDETLAELGLITAPGAADAAALGLRSLIQTLPLDAQLADRLAGSVGGEGRVVKGSSLTVLGLPGDETQAGERAGRFPGRLVENMEGFALAQVARALGQRAAEVRGVSNMAGARDKAAWDLNAANRAAQAVALTHLRRRSDQA